MLQNDRVGSWLQTFTGKQFYPLDPRAEDVDVRDIAHALSLICRFGGHVTKHYSVAQHSVIVSEIVPPHLALEGLLHDAAEAYIGDMVRPLKSAMPEYKAVELRIERVLAQSFGLVFPFPPAIKSADLRACMTEKRDLHNVQRAWTPRAEPLPETIEPWDAQQAEAIFLARFVRLAAARPRRARVGGAA